MTVRIKLTTWCTFVVRFMRDQLAYEKVHAFQAHYQSIDQEVKNYKKDLTDKNPESQDRRSACDTPPEPTDEAGTWGKDARVIWVHPRLNTHQ